MVARRRRRAGASDGKYRARLVAELLDAKRCCYVDENGVRCGKDAWQLGYCATHWGR